MKATDNRDIICLISSDPQRGFARLVERFKEPVYWHIRRMVGSHFDAEDATQETFVKLYRSRASLVEVENLRAWVYRIATNEALRLIQQRAPDGLDINSPEVNGQQLYAEEYYDYSDIEGVKFQEIVDTLPPKQKLIFSLRYYDDLPYEEIARVADTSVASAKVCFHIAKAKVISLLNIRFINK